MRAPSTLLAAALLLAGCLAPAAEEAAEAVRGVASGVRELDVRTASGAVPPIEEVLRGATRPVMKVVSVGTGGAEPTMGVTSNGYLFFVAYNKVLRSTDGGASWEVVSPHVDLPGLGPLRGASAPPTLDPMLWVDPATDRVFVDQLYVGCSYLSWSDDLGKTWVTNPAACGLPANDHQKVATGPNLGKVPQSPLYPNVVYYAYNGLSAGARVSASFDGGLTFPQNARATPPTCVGGLHGSLAVAPDGTLYLPKRDCDGPTVAVSRDSGATWEAVKVGEDVGTTPCQKNPEVATDVANHAYLFWPAADDRLYLSRSRDGGATWDATSLRVSPDFLNVVTMPAAQAGDEGRFAVAYYGTDAVPEVKDADLDPVDRALGQQPGPRHGPDTVPEDAVWHLWITYSLDALADDPTFVTVRVTEDPVQIGPISTNSSGCPNPPGSRNLLDFIDMVSDAQGRTFVAFADGCVDECVDEPTMKKSREDLGMVGILSEGPSLFAAGALAAYTGPE